MAMVVKVILAISVLLEVTSTAPLPPNGTTIVFKRELKVLDDTIQRMLPTLKNCGEQQIQKVDFPNQNICPKYNKTFCEVKMALQNASKSHCDWLAKNITIPDILHENYVNCTIPVNNSIKVMDFLKKLQQYVRTVKHQCASHTNIS